MNIRNINNKKKHIILIAILLLVSMLASITVSAEESIEQEQVQPIEIESKIQTSEPESEQEPSPPVAEENTLENESIEPASQAPENTDSAPDETTAPETTEPETPTESIPEPEIESESETETENNVLDSETADLLKQYLENSVSNNNVEESPSDESTLLPDENMEKVLAFLEEYKSCWIDLSHDIKSLIQTHFVIGCTVTIGIGILVGLLIFRRWH